MRNSRRTLLLFAALTTAIAQPVQQVHPNPDCQFFFTLTAAGNLPAGNGFDNRQQGCTTWNFSYVNSGFSGLTVTLQTAANNNGAAGSWSAGFAVQQSTISGSNAATSTTGGFWWAQGYNAFVRVNLSGTTGSGIVQGAVFGWRIPNAGGAGGGGSIVCLTGDVSAGSGSGCTTATVQGIKSVPFCTGYTPTNGQFVQYTTGGTPSPCYSATSAAGAGSFALVEEHTASSSAALNFTTCISSTYDTYQVEIVNISPATSGAQVFLQFSTNGGSSYDSGAHYNWSGFLFRSVATAATGANADTQIILSSSAAGITPSSFGMGATLKLINPAGLAQVWGQSNFSDSVSLLGESIAAQYTVSGANAFRLIASTGNLASGTARCYGLAK